MHSSSLPGRIGLIVGAMVALHTVAAIGAEAMVWDFAGNDALWSPRDKGIAVERVDIPGPDGRPTAAMRVHGQLTGHFNYAGSRSIAAAAKQPYRLSAWVKVDKLGAATPAPYFKCEFNDQGRQKTLLMHTETYDRRRIGQWQQLKGEAVSPEWAKTCWVALEKGTQDAAEIDAYLADVRLEPIARLTTLDKYHLDPLPAPLAKMRNVHPRLFITSAGVEQLRRDVQTTHAELWKKVAAQADRAVKSGPPAYILRDKTSGDEQLWQRNVGNTIPLLAMAYLASGDRKYLASAQQWAIASCSYATWGLGHYDGKDLAAGHQMLGLSLLYDWCYRDLDEAVRARIKQTLLRRGAVIFEAAASGTTGWSRAYLQNHLWISATGLGAAGMALFDDEPATIDWIGLALDKFRRTTDALGSDGASHEGVGYWEYGVEYLLKFMDLADKLLGVDLYTVPWWRNTAGYVQYLTLPRHAWRMDSCIVDIADCPRGHWYGPDYLLRQLARHFQDSHAQWLADEVDRADVSAPAAGWLNLLWYDPKLPAKSPADLPTLHHFDDLGIVSSRTDWSGDESLLVFKCGPCLGHELLKKYSYAPGAGHVHPDANHFVLFGAGEWLIRDDGYHPKFSAGHNTLLVNGRGQLGEGAEWFQGDVTMGKDAIQPRVARAASSPQLDEITGDAAGAYPRELGVRRFIRHLLFMKPDVLIVADDIALDRDADLELRFHPEADAQRDGNGVVAPGKHAVLRITPLTADGIELTAGPQPLPGRRGSAGARIPTVILRTRRSTWHNAVALTWAAEAGRVPAVTLQIEGSRWIFTAGSRRAELDRAATGK